MFDANSLLFSFVLGITPDGRIVGRSLLYGGKAAECIDIVNRSTLVAALKANVPQPKQELFFFHELVFPAMGHVPHTGRI